MKATFFTRLGYQVEDWRRLHKDLLEMAQTDAATAGRFTRYGNKYELRASLKGPSGRSAMVVTIWMVRHGEDFPRFITAFPHDAP